MAGAKAYETEAEWDQIPNISIVKKYIPKPWLKTKKRKASISVEEPPPEKKAKVEWPIQYKESEEKKYKLGPCTWPECTYVIKDHPERHMTLHTREKQFKCEVCGKCFRLPGGLASHAKFHTGEKPFKCAICNKGFSQAGSRIIHMRLHTGEMPYKCDECGKLSRHITAHKTHKRMHSGEKPYKCDVCSKQFNAQSNLITHGLIHTGKKPHGCKYCDKSFRVKYMLDNHEKTHRGEKLHVCIECGHAFTQKGALQVHMRMHTKERPFHCEWCDYKAASGGSLSTHMFTHTGERPHPCKLCDARFTTSGNLATHVASHHTPEGQRRQKKTENKMYHDYEKEGLKIHARDPVVNLGCVGGSSMRPDYVHEAEKAAYWSECDENWHEGYPVSCDARRMMMGRDSQFAADDPRFLVFIRNNPHKYTVSGAPGTMKYTQRIREAVKLHSWLPPEDSESKLHVWYVCYPVRFNKEHNRMLPCICDDPEYPRELIPYVKCIY